MESRKIDKLEEDERETLYIFLKMLACDHIKKRYRPN